MSANLLVIVILVVTLLVLPGRRHGLRLGLVFVLLVVGAGLFATTWMSVAASRQRVVAMEHAATAERSAAAARAEAHVVLGDGTLTIITTVPDALEVEVDPELLDSVRLPIVRFEDDRLIVGGYAALKSTAEPPEDPVLEPAHGVTLQAVARREVASKLTTFFNELVVKPPGAAAPQLRELRATLEQLLPVQRRGLAADLARRDDIITQEEKAQINAPEGGALEYYAFRAIIAPEQVQRLIASATIPTLAQDRSALGPVPRILLIVGTVVVAAIVLKITTRRTTGAKSA